MLTDLKTTSTHCNSPRHCCHHNYFDGHILVWGRCTLTHFDIGICPTNKKCSCWVRSFPRPFDCDNRSNHHIVWTWVDMDHCRDHSPHTGSLQSDIFGTLSTKHKTYSVMNKSRR